MTEEELDRHARAAETKKRRTRQRITEAVLNLFDEEHPLTLPTLEQIAEEAGVGVATLYSHFNTKFELYHEVLKIQFAPLSRPIMSAIAANVYQPADLRSEVVSYVTRAAILAREHRQLLGAYLQAYFETRQYVYSMPMSGFISEGLLEMLKTGYTVKNSRFLPYPAEYHSDALLLAACKEGSGLFKMNAHIVALSVLGEMLPRVDKLYTDKDFAEVKRQVETMTPEEANLLS